MLDILLAGQDPGHAMHFTNAGTPVTFQSNTYVPLPWERGTLSEKVATSADETPDVQMTITNVNQQMAQLLNQVQTELAQATLWITDRRLLPTLATRPRNAVRLTIGEIRDLQLSDTTLTFRIINVIGQKQRVTVPLRVYQANCNYLFGSPSCGFNRAGNDSNGKPATITTTAQPGTTNYYIALPTGFLAGIGVTSANATDFFANGDVLITDGVAGLQCRPVQRYDVIAGQERMYVRNGFFNAPLAGDPVTIRRRCRKTLDDCQMYQGNVLQYGGFPFVPPIRYKPIAITPPTPLPA
jgi:hypothetical protein